MRRSFELMGFAGWQHSTVVRTRQKSATQPFGDNLISRTFVHVKATFQESAFHNKAESTHSEKGSFRPIHQHQVYAYDSGYQFVGIQQRQRKTMDSDLQSWLHAACQWLNKNTAEYRSEAVIEVITSASGEELEALLQVIQGQLGQDSEFDPKRLQLLMQQVVVRLQALPGEAAERGEADPYCIESQLLLTLYHQVKEFDLVSAAHVLQILSLQALIPDDESVETLAAVLGDAPPSNWEQVGLAISPLWRASGETLEFFFERLDGGFLRPTTLAVLLDLANFAVRNARVEQHPWASRAKQLGQLLHQVVVQLEGLQRDPTKYGEDVSQIQNTLSDSVSLTVALCDSLGLIGEQSQLEPLRLAADLSHRRIQAEAAGALARLGDQQGEEQLIKLAETPVARLRAVQYAEELDIAEKIEERYRYPQALAESELAGWLAAPEQFGFPPSSLEHIDTRTQYWPSYDEPRDCYLFRYTYNLPQGTVSNIGIAGPLTHAFHSDLANLPVDDIYAAFAGWQAEHEEIYEIPMSLLNVSQRQEADRLIEALEGAGLEVTESIALTFLLGDVALLAKLEQDGKPLCGVADGEELVYFPVPADGRQSSTSLTPELILSIFRGRKLLRAFNK